MAKYLISSVDTYRVDSEMEAKELIEAAKADPMYNLKKYTTEKRCTKSKGEIVDEWLRCQLTREFTSEKEPESTFEISFEEV